jgi:hypothetical protein
VVVGMMYIFPDFSLKTSNSDINVLVGQLSKTLSKTSPRLNIFKMFLCCKFLTKHETKVDKNCRLRAKEIQPFFCPCQQFVLTLTSRFVKNMPNKNLEMFSPSFTELAKHIIFIEELFSARNQAKYTPYLLLLLLPFEGLAGFVAY